MIYETCTIWYHLYVESKKAKLVESEKRWENWRDVFKRTSLQLKKNLEIERKT